jgi:hypothetical protein
MASEAAKTLRTFSFTIELPEIPELRRNRCRRAAPAKTLHCALRLQDVF